MTTYTTPGPVALTVRFAAGSLRVESLDRTDVSIDVSPQSSSSHDRDHAAATVIEQFGNEIRVIAPESKGWFGRTPSLNVRASVPNGTSATITVDSADVTLTGQLGAVDLNSSSGNSDIERGDALSITSASGDVTCREIAGDAACKTASGDVRFGRVGGDGKFYAASGDVTVDSVDGSADFKASSGDITVERVGGSVSTRAASGDVRIGSVESGTVDIDTASGDVTIGIAAGVAAWLDLHSLSGDVSMALGETSPPEGDTRTVAVTARSMSGDIRIVRAH